jgi:hypothetical protein
MENKIVELSTDDIRAYLHDRGMWICDQSGLAMDRVHDFLRAQNMTICSVPEGCASELSSKKDPAQESDQYLAVMWFMCIYLLYRIYVCFTRIFPQNTK